MSNPYAPPRAVVQDIVDPNATVVPAERGTRLGAALLDGLIFMATVYAPVALGAMLRVESTDASTTGGAILAAGVGLGLIGFAAWCWFTIKYVRRNGQSIGKKLLGIKVIRTSGAPVTLGRLFWLRNVVNNVISIVPFYAFLDLLFIFGESRQCLHDRIADTMVVKA